METIKEVLMSRDGMSASAADELIEDARTKLQERILNEEIGDPHEICRDFFGLEEDYIYELL